MTDALINALESIAENGPPDIDRGICGNVETIMGRCLTVLEERVLRHCFKTWPHFNGNTAYPIGNDITEYYFSALKWDREDDYGALRWDLLAHCISKMNSVPAMTHFYILQFLEGQK